MKRHGFTLVETLITVMVLALLAAFTVPTYQLILSQVQLNSAVEEVSDFIRLASQKTVTEQQVYGVTLTTGSVTIPMYQLTSGVKTTVSTYDMPTNMQLGTISLGSGNDVSFTTSGAPSVSGTFTVIDTLRNRTRTIEIRPSGTIKNNQAEQ
jgi:prepilin-type N-terminal cleavage/methylation domain-containing protein